MVLLEVVNETTAEKNRIRASLGLPPLIEPAPKGSSGPTPRGSNQTR